MPPEAKNHAEGKGMDEPSADEQWRREPCEAFSKADTLVHFLCSVARSQKQKVSSEVLPQIQDEAQLLSHPPGMGEAK